MADQERLREVAAQLRGLVDSSPRSPDAVDAWTTAAHLTYDSVVGRYPDIALPIQVMHYVHDADIRARDAHYAADQDQTMRDLIADLERGIIPSSRGITFRVAIRDVAPILLIAAIIIGAVLWAWATS